MRKINNVDNEKERREIKREKGGGMEKKIKTYVARMR
jgi:hypothetical protein